MQVSGSTAVAIFSVISNISFIAKGLFGGMAQASQPLISLNYGLKDFTVVNLAYRFAMWVGGGSGLIAFLLILPRLLAYLLVLKRYTLIQK